MTGREEVTSRPATEMESTARDGKSSVARRTDTYRELTAELVAAIGTLADNAVCDCDEVDCACEFRERASDAYHDAQRRLWLADLDGSGWSR